MIIEWRISELGSESWWGSESPVWLLYDLSNDISLVTRNPYRSTFAMLEC